MTTRKEYAEAAATMTPTEARALAQIFDGYYVGAAIRDLADQVERQAEDLTILDGFTWTPPTRAQWDEICALAQALKKVIAQEVLTSKEAHDLGARR